MPDCPERCGGRRCGTQGFDQETLDIRTQAGCDGPAKGPYNPVFYITCTVCHGARWIDRPSGDGVMRCKRCDEGSIPMDRCPTSYQSGLESFLAAYGMISKHGIWPAEGGIEDQTCQLVEAVRVLGQEISAIETALHEQAKKVR